MEKMVRCKVFSQHTTVYDHNLYVLLVQDSVVLTCVATCFMKGSRSSNMSYPWWKNVLWAPMNDSIYSRNG